MVRTIFIGMFQWLCENSFVWLFVISQDCHKYLETMTENDKPNKRISRIEDIFVLQNTKHVKP